MQSVHFYRYDFIHLFDQRHYCIYCEFPSRWASSSDHNNLPGIDGKYELSSSLMNGSGPSL